MNILITGINSILGAELAKSLLGDGHKIAGLFNVNQTNIPAGISSFHFTEANNLPFSPDLIFYIGAFVPRGNYNLPDEKFKTINVDSIANLISLFPNARHVFTSSVAVYGNNHNIIMENSETIDATLYGQSKLQGENLVKETKSWAILRFSSIYGKNIASINFINRSINQALQNREILLYGNGSREQNYIYLKDVILFLKIAAFDTKNEIYLCTSSKSYSNNEIAAIICNLLPKTKIIYAGQDNSASYHYANSATRKMLNFNQETTIQQGIAETLSE